MARDDVAQRCMNGDIGKIRKKYNRRKKKEGEVKKKQSTNTE
jgi:hypothetical protein